MVHAADASLHSSSYDSEDIAPVDLEELYPRSIALGISIEYVDRWSPLHAFRELYQNWKDGIVEAFQLAPGFFRPTWEVTPAFIDITVKRAVTKHCGSANQELLGFIRFDRKAGSLELTNFNAKLELRNLSLGGTSKRGKDNMAGMHGEGLKLAALVMRRHNHTVRLSASSFYWNFTFRGRNQDRFYCNLTQPRTGTLAKLKAAASMEQGQGCRRSLKANIWEDVTVMIGKGRGSSKIAEEDFRSWTTCAVDLCGPEDGMTILTVNGNLILDKSFAGKVYLKGLYVSNLSPNGVPYTYGYDFVRGSINRDRERLISPNEEARMLAGIWEIAMINLGDCITRRYRELFDKENCPDVLLGETYLAKRAATLLRDFMKRASPGAFFYPEESAESIDQEAVITKHLNLTAEPIPRRLWQAIARHGLLRMPQVERRRRFERSKPLDQPTDVFGSYVLRFLKACFITDSGESPFTITLVEGGETGVDALYSDQDSVKTVLVAGKWFDFQHAHRDSPCELSLANPAATHNTRQFSCDHIVEDLFQLVCNELPKAIAPTDSSQRVTRGRLRQTPRGVVAQVSPNNEIVVRWTGNESAIVARHYASSMFYTVTLHRMSTCSDSAAMLVDSTSMYDDHCGCPQEVVCRTSSEVTFQVQGSERYFPMVSRYGIMSFFGVPPDPIMIREGYRPLSPPPAAGSAVSPSYSPASPSFMMHRPLNNDLEPSYGPFDPSSRGLGRHDDGEVPFNTTTASSCLSEHQNRSFHTEMDVNDRESRVASSILTSPSFVSPSQMVDWKKDWEEWRNWHAEKLPAITSDIFYNATVWPSYCKKVSNVPDYTAFVSERLECKFETGLYYRLQISMKGPLEYIALVRSIHNSGECQNKPTHLNVTLYSSLAAEPLLRQTPTCAITASDSASKELLLHCHTHDFMGSRLDTHIIQIDDIARAHGLPRSTTRVAYCIEPTTDKSAPFFCRYARSGGDSATTFMPLAPDLVGDHGRRKSDGFAAASPTSVIDFTPGVLGPLEGFLAGIPSKPHAGIGFDESRDVSWRARYSNCKVFDGELENVFREFPLSQLRPPADCPTVALVSGKNGDFALTSAHKQMPDLDAFVEPLNLLTSVVASELKPDFTVLQMSPAVLHERSLGNLGRSVLRCVENGQVVRVNLVSHENIDLATTGKTLVVVASPFPAMLLARPMLPAMPQSTKTIRNYIGELNAEKTRASRACGAEFVCAAQELPEGQRTSTLLYNHNTSSHLPGHSRACGDVEVSLDDVGVPISCYSPYTLKHSVRGRKLSVREIARLQGFPDDFAFYGQRTWQYYDVMSAQSPVISRIIARMIGGVLLLLQKKETRDEEPHDSPAKRRKVF